MAILPFVAKAWEYPSSTQELPYEEGLGTKENPFIIKNEQQLANLSYYVNNGETYDGMYFQLGNDIDLNPGYTFNPDDENRCQDASIVAHRPIPHTLLSHQCHPRTMLPEYTAMVLA